MSIKSNYFYNTIGKILKIFIAVVTVPYVSRVLGSENIGIYSYTYTIATYFVLFIMLGLENYGNREIAKSKNDQKNLYKTASEIYFMQLIIGIIVFLAYIIYSFMVGGIYSMFLKLQSIYLASSLIDINWMLSGLEEFKFTSIRKMAFNLISLVMIVLFVKNKDSLIIYIIILSCLAVVTNLTCWIYVRKIIKFQKVRLYDILKHIKPNLILFIPIIAVSLYKMMDKIMMGSMSAIDQVGFYESSEKIIQIPTLLISSLGTVMLPRMSSLYSSGNYSDAYKYMKKSIDGAMIISTSLCFGIMGVAREFVPLFYGKGYDLCADLYLILLPCCIFLAFSNVIRTQYLIPKSKDKIYIFAVVSGAVVNIIVNFLLIPQLGAMGAAIGTLIAEITVCTTQSIAVKNDLPIKQYIKRTIPFIILGCIMFIVLFNIRFTLPLLMQLVFKIIIGTVIYCIGLAVILFLGKDIYQVKLTDFLSLIRNKS